MVLMEMSPPFHSNFSFHCELFNVIPNVFANFRMVADRLPLVLNSLGRGSTSMLVGSQFLICACLSLIHVEMPAGPVLFNLANIHEIWLSLSTFQTFWMLY